MIILAGGAGTEQSLALAARRPDVTRLALVEPELPPDGVDVDFAAVTMPTLIVVRAACEARVRRDALRLWAALPDVQHRTLAEDAGDGLDGLLPLLEEFVAPDGRAGGSSCSGELALGPEHVA